VWHVVYSFVHILWYRVTVVCIAFSCSQQFSKIWIDFSFNFQLHMSTTILDHYVSCKYVWQQFFWTKTRTRDMCTRFSTKWESFWVVCTVYCVFSNANENTQYIWDEMERFLPCLSWKPDPWGCPSWCLSNYLESTWGIFATWRWILDRVPELSTTQMSGPHPDLIQVHEKTDNRPHSVIYQLVWVYKLVQEKKWIIKIHIKR
jgi:hypothetical protein